MNFIIVSPAGSPGRKHNCSLVDRKPLDRSNANCRAEEKAFGLRARLCRESAVWQVVRDALDQLWQNLVPMWRGGPHWWAGIPERAQAISYIREGATSRLLLAFRASSVYCFRLQVEATCGQHTCNARRANGTDNDLFRHLVQDITLDEGIHPSGLSGNASAGTPAQMLSWPPTPRVDTIVSKIWQHAHSVDMATKVDKVASSTGDRGRESQLSLCCSCAHWTGHRTLWNRTSRLRGYYDTTSLECNDTTPAKVVLQKRRAFQTEAVHRLTELDVNKLTACTAYGELAIFCDVYRYQQDFLASAQHSGNVAEQHAGDLRAVLRRLASISSDPASTADGVCTVSLQITFSHFKRLRTSTKSAYECMCEGMGLADSFRFADGMM